jgi:hypothetical protein
MNQDQPGWLGKQLRETQDRIKTYPQWMQDAIASEVDYIRNQYRDTDVYPKWLERKFGNY